MRAHGAARRQQRLGLVDQARVPRGRVLLGERHVVAVRHRAARRGAPRRAASARAGPAPRARPAAARRRAGRARSLPRRGCAGAPRCRRDRSSLRRRRRRSRRAPHRAAPASSARSGTRNGMPASRILLLARTSRWPIVAGATRNAEAIVAASKPEHGLQDQRRADAGIDRRMGAGEHQRAGARRECRLGARGLAAPRRSAADARRRRRRCAGAARRRSACAAPPSSATPRGFAECRCAGQSASAAAKASDSASSAAATSRVRAARIGDQLAVAAARHRSAVRARAGPRSSRHRPLHRPDRPHLDRAVAARRGSAPPRTSAASRSGTSIR